MKRILLTILLLLALVGNGWGATYYVDNSITDTNVGSATPDFTTYDPTTFATTGGSASVYKTLADVTAKSFSAGDVIYLRRGQTWAERFKNNSAGIRVSSFGDPLLGYPIITGNATYCLENTAGNDKTFEHLWFKGKQLYFQTATGTVIQKCIISDNTTSAAVTVGVGVTFYNNLFIRNFTRAIYGTGASIVKNNLFYGTGDIYGPLYPITGGSITYSYNFFGGGTHYPSSSALSTVCKSGGGTCIDGGGNITDASPNDPKFTAYQYPVPRVVMFFSNDADWCVSAMSAVSPYGVKGSYHRAYGFVSSETTGQKASIQSLVDDGKLEINVRSGSGNKLTHSDIFQITTTNTGTVTFTQDGETTKTLTLTSTGNADNNITLDWSAGNCVRTIGAGAPSQVSSVPCDMDDFDAAISGHGWTKAGANYESHYLRLSSLKNSTCTTFPCQVSLDDSSGSSRWYYDETIAAKAAVEADFPGYTVTSFTYPYGEYNAAVVSYIQANTTFKGAEGTDAITTIPDGEYLDSVNVFSVHGTGASYYKGDGSEATLRAAARTLHGWARGAGGILVFYLHSGDLTTQQLVYFVDELNKMGVVWTTFSELLDWIKSDHSTADSITYTKTYSDGDYHLTSSSPAINAGTDVGLTTDIEGNPIKGLPDIGAYEFQGGGSCFRIGGEFRCYSN